MNRDSLISLRIALNFAEEELGIQSLSEIEKKLYYAALDCADSLGNFSSEVIRNSKWCKRIPHATYHRALTSMLEAHTFMKVPGSQRNYYRLPLA